MVPKPEYVTGIRCLKIGCPGKLRCIDTPVTHSYEGIADTWSFYDGFSLAIACSSCRMEMTVRLSDDYRLIKHEDDSSIAWEIVSVLEALQR